MSSKHVNGKAKPLKQYIVWEKEGDKLYDHKRLKEHKAEAQRKGAFGDFVIEMKLGDDQKKKKLELLVCKEEELHKEPQAPWELIVKPQQKRVVGDSGKKPPKEPKPKPWKAPKPSDYDSYDEQRLKEHKAEAQQKGAFGDSVIEIKMGDDQKKKKLGLLVCKEEELHKEPQAPWELRVKPQQKRVVVGDSGKKLGEPKAKPQQKAVKVKEI